jgi:cob(I)alamin adenosyltransferase
MLKAFSVIAAAIALSVAAAITIVHKAGPSTSELDADIASIRAEITTTDADMARYSGGLMLLQIQLRYAILQNTLAMLEQKRASFLRGITLTYQDQVQRIATPNDDSTAASDLAKARSDARAAEREAALYSGGLIQTMALVREATAKVTEAAIEQRIALMKLGIPIPSPSGAVPPPPKSPGKPTSDKEAL